MQQIEMGALIVIMAALAGFNVGVASKKFTYGFATFTGLMSLTLAITLYH